MSEAAVHQPPTIPDVERKIIRLCRYVNAAILFLLALIFFLIPPCLVIRDLSDPNLRSPGIPRSAWKLHRTLSPGFERWIRQRLESERTATLSTTNISGTEWPLFGAVFYLWATESLQDEWEKNRQPEGPAPKEVFR